MAKLFTPNNSSTNIPTAEQNQAEFLSMQKQSQRNLDLQTEDMLTRKRIEQSGNIDLATEKKSKSAVLNDEYGQIGNPDLNQDMNQQPQAKDLDDIHNNSLGKFTNSIPPIITNLIFIFLGILIIRFLFGKRR